MFQIIDLILGFIHCTVVSLFFFFFKILFILFLERGKGKEKERERNISGWFPLPHPPTGDLVCNPGICPYWELNWRPFGSQAGLNPLSYSSQGYKLLFISISISFISDWIFSVLLRFSPRFFTILIKSVLNSASDRLHISILFSSFSGFLICSFNWALFLCLPVLAASLCLVLGIR